MSKTNLIDVVGKLLDIQERCETKVTGNTSHSRHYTNIHINSDTFYHYTIWIRDPDGEEKRFEFSRSNPLSLRRGKGVVLVFIYCPKIQESH